VLSRSKSEHAPLERSWEGPNGSPDLEDVLELIEREKHRLAELERVCLNVAADSQMGQEDALRLALRIVELERAGSELVREGDTAIYPRRSVFWEKAKARWLSSVAQ
jgi:hypothetical protein